MKDNKKESNNDETRVYELGFLLTPNIEEENLTEKVSVIKKLFDNKGAKFISEGLPKFIDLSYTITKKIDGNNESFENAYFGWLKYEIEQDLINSLEEVLKQDEDIIRFLLIKTVKESTYTDRKINPKHSIIHKPIREEKIESSPEKTKESEKEIDKAIDELTKE